MGKRKSKVKPGNPGRDEMLIVGIYRVYYLRVFHRLVFRVHLDDTQRTSGYCRDTWQQVSAFD